VEIASVDQGDVHVPASQRLRGREPAESAANNDYFVSLSHRLFLDVR
jgi:hypothetical protein